jgi:hypothetical protein
MIPLRCWIASVVAGVALAVAGCVQMPQTSVERRVLGAPAALGNGSVASYADFAGAGNLAAIGVIFSRGALDGLPAAPSDGHRCFDANKDGRIDVADECARWHERALPLPAEASRRADIPFKWALLNWNPHGHIPPGIYDRPHFDVHFYIDAIESVFAIEPGPCGPERVRCDQFSQARLPIPTNYMHPDFKDVEAVAPAMGNHLVDLTGPEFKGEPFTRSWIYGVYAGRVTFYEEMVTVDYLRSRPDRCFPIKKPPAVAITGHYPTRSCIRYLPESQAYTVSLEGFELREASAPGV